MFLQQVGERFVGQFLNRRHPVARKLLKLVEGVVVEGNQLAQAWSVPRGQRRLAKFKRGAGKWFRRSDPRKFPPGNLR